jgi:hypothetical protein
VSALVKAELGDGQVCWFEISEPAGESIGGGSARASVSRRSGEDPVAAAATIDFDKAMGAVKAAAAQLGRAMEALEVRPDDYEITFGVKISTKVGALIAEASGEANFTVKLAWKGRGAKKGARAG